MRTIWLPLLWVFATLFDVIYYAEGKPTSAVGQFFESLVFFSNFLVYALQWQLREIAPMGRVILPAATQFLFWWIVGILGYLAIEKIRASERELK